MRTCWNCYSTYQIELHHVFYGTGQRKISEAQRFKVDLCATCHRSQPQGIHGGNKKLDLELKKHFQAEYEKTHSREEFIKLIGRNYLD